MTTTGEAIIAALRVKHPQRPGDLANALKMDTAALRYQVKALIQSGAVIATGATMNRLYSLPRQAKEAH